MHMCTKICMKICEIANDVMQREARNVDWKLFVFFASSEMYEFRIKSDVAVFAEDFRNVHRTITRLVHLTAWTALIGIYDDIPNLANALAPTRTFDGSLDADYQLNGLLFDRLLRQTLPGRALKA